MKTTSQPYGSVYCTVNFYKVIIQQALFRLMLTPCFCHMPEAGLLLRADRKINNNTFFTLYSENGITNGGIFQERMPEEEMGNIFLLFIFLLPLEFMSKISLLMEKLLFQMQ